MRFEPMTYVLPVQWCTNLVTKPHSWGQVSLLGSFVPVKYYLFLGTILFLLRCNNSYITQNEYFLKQYNLLLLHAYYIPVLDL